MPPNANLFFTALMHICAFDPIDTEDFWHEKLEVESTGALTQNFETIGWESKWFIVNLGSFTFFIIIIPFLFLISPLLRPCNENYRVMQFRRYLDSSLIWGVPLRIMMESYMIVLIPALINMTHLKFNSYGAAINSGLSLLYITIALLIPIQVRRFIKRYRN